MAASVMMAITGISSNLLGKHEFLKFVCGTDQNDGTLFVYFFFLVSLSLSWFSYYTYDANTHTQIQSAQHGEYVSLV